MVCEMCESAFAETTRTEGGSTPVYSVCRPCAVRMDEIAADWDGRGPSWRAAVVAAVVAVVAAVIVVAVLGALGPVVAAVGRAVCRG